MNPGLRHGDTDGLLITDHTSRLSRMETSFQEILPIVSQTQTVIMGVHESLLEIKSDIKELKEGHVDVSINLVKFGQRIDIIDDWKKAKEKAREDHRKLIKRTLYGALGTVIAAAVIFLLGWK
jgi:hypothetical protein